MPWKKNERKKKSKCFKYNLIFPFQPLYWLKTFQNLRQTIIRQMMQITSSHELHNIPSWHLSIDLLTTHSLIFMWNFHNNNFSFAHIIYDLCYDTEKIQRRIHLKIQMEQPARFLMIRMLLHYFINRLIHNPIQEINSFPNSQNSIHIISAWLLISARLSFSSIISSVYSFSRFWIRSFVWHFVFCHWLKWSLTLWLRYPLLSQLSIFR